MTNTRSLIRDRQPIRIALVDDEPLARAWIRQLLEGDDDVTVTAEYGDGLSAIEGLLAEPVDVVFLDVQMPEADGFAVLNALRTAELPLVVFVTAYDEYAIRAFEQHALDYLLKPFDATRFRAALARVKCEVLRDREGVSRRLSTIIDALYEERNRAERIPVHTNGRIILVNARDVDWIEADDNHARLHVGKTTHLVRDTLTRLATSLDPRRFLRIHRSFVVNVDRVREIQPMFRGEHVVILHDGTRLTVGRSYRAGLTQLLAGDL